MGTAVVVGDKRKFACVLISPNFDLLEEWARSNGVPCSSRADLIEHGRVQSLYEEVVEAANEKLARFEQLKRVVLVPEEFTAENGALTPTMKLRRRVVEERYRRQIDDLYAQAEASQRP